MELKAKARYLLIEVNQPKLFGINSGIELTQLEPRYSNEYSGFIIIDRNNNTQIWSPHFFKSLGFLPNEISPSYESLEKIIHPSDFEIIKNITQEMGNLISKAFMIKIRYKTKFNTYRVLKSRVKLIGQ